MKISYIIVCYKSQDLIKDCINSIIKFNKLLSHEIIVVDNSPIEFQLLTENIISKIDYNIKYLKSDNVGYGAGNNKGIKNCTGDIIAIVNPDVRFVSEVDTFIVKEFKNKNLGLLGLKQIGGANLSYYLMPEYYFPFLSGFLTKVFNRFNWFIPNLFFLSGACMFLSKDIFNKIGLFDEKLFMYFEEADVTKRLTKNDYQIKYVKSIEYVHLIGNRTQFNKQIFKIWNNSYLYYFNKYNISLNLNFKLHEIEYFFREKEAFKFFRKNDPSR